MQLCKPLQKIQWAWVPYFYLSLIMIGVCVGSPLAAEYYHLNIATEVDELFFLMPVMYFFLSIPLCVFAAAGLNHPRLNDKKHLRLIYIVLCTIFLPTIFYGIGVSLYYRN